MENKEPKQSGSNLSDYSQIICKENQKLHDKQDELNILLEALDQEQKKNQKLTKEHFRLETEIDSIKNRISCHKIINKNHIGIDLENEIEFDLSQLSDEHRNYLLDMKNRRANLQEEYDQMTEISENENAVFQNLKEENETLKLSIQKYRSDLQATSAELRKTKELQNFTTSGIKEQEQSIRSLKRQVNEAETALSVVIERHSRFETSSSGEIGMNCEIKNLNGCIAQEEIINEQLQQDINTLSDRKKSEKQKIECQKQQFQKCVNWPEHEAQLNSILKSETKKLNELIAQNEQYDTQYQKKLIRFKKLQQIMKKWKGKSFPLIPDHNIDQSIDKLLEKREKLISNLKNTNTNTTNYIEDIIANNSKIEIRISKLKEELNQSIEKLKFEQQKIQKSIEIKRSKAFNEEHEVIDKIAALKLKIAQTQMK